MRRQPVLLSDGLWRGVNEPNRYGRPLERVAIVRAGAGINAQSAIVLIHRVDNGASGKPSPKFLWTYFRLFVAKLASPTLRGPGGDAAEGGHLLPWAGRVPVLDEVNGEAVPFDCFFFVHR